MQLEEMQYFDSTMQDAPAADDYWAVLKWALSDEKIVNYDSINKQIISFRSSHGMSEHTTYTFIDINGESVRSKVERIDKKNVRIIKNISHLSKKITIVIKSPKYVYSAHENEEQILNEKGFGFLKKQDDGVYAFQYYSEEERNETFVSETSLMGDGEEWVVFVSNDALVNLYHINGHWIGFFFIRELSQRYVHWAMARHQNNGPGPGISFKFLFDSHESQSGSDIWTNQIDILGGKFSEFMINQESLESDEELLPVFSPYSYELIPRFLHSVNGVKPLKSPIEFRVFGDTQVVYFKASGNTHLIFEVGYA